MAFNRVILMGRLVAKPEIKSTSEGTEYTRFSVAVDRSYTKKGEEKQADFINCTAWRQTAVFLNKYFNKGDMVHIEGEWHRDSYDKDGEKRYTDFCLVNNVSFCGGKSESGNTAQGNTAAAENEEDIDYPF